MTTPNQSPEPAVPEKLPSGMATSQDGGKWRVTLEFDAHSDADALKDYMLRNGVPAKSMVTAPAVPQGEPFEWLTDERIQSLWRYFADTNQVIRIERDRFANLVRTLSKLLPPPAPAQEPDYRIDDEAQLQNAIAVMNDVIAEIGDWEDQALADSVRSSRADLQAMVESIRFMAAPAQEPVTLTDEEIAECINTAKTSLFARDGTTSFRIARAVIAALREKEAGK